MKFSEKTEEVFTVYRHCVSPLQKKQETSKKIKKKIFIKSLKNHFQESFSLNVFFFHKLKMPKTSSKQVLLFVVFHKNPPETHPNIKTNSSISSKML